MMKKKDNRFLYIPRKQFQEETIKKMMNQMCVFIEYHSPNGAGKIVMLRDHYLKKSLQIRKAFKDCEFTLFEERKFVEEDIEKYFGGI